MNIKIYLNIEAPIIIRVIKSGQQMALEIGSCAAMMIRATNIGKRL